MDTLHPNLIKVNHQKKPLSPSATSAISMKFLIARVIFTGWTKSSPFSLSNRPQVSMVYLVIIVHHYISL